MAHRLIGPLSLRRVKLDTINNLSPLYCGCCKQYGAMSTQPQYRRHRSSGSHNYTYLPSYNCTFTHNKSSSYYKTKHLISPDFSLGSIPLGSIRYFHISSKYNEKDKSFVEKAVEVLKDKKRTDKKGDGVSDKDLQPGVDKEKVDDKLTGDQQSTIVKAKPTLLQTIKKHGKYYLDGFVLFFKELRIAVSYLWKNIVKGETLTRRELKQPDVLLKEGLKRKQEMAKLLQETLQQTSLERKKKDAPSMVSEFTDFMEKVRSEGIAVSNEEILHFSTMFEDEVTIDSLTRGQLQALCRVLSIIPIGTDQMLRFQLDIKLRRLLVDDKMIQKEGIEALTVQELQQANRARGMRALGVDKERLIFQLEQWLDLHLNQHVPTSLLLLSRALYLPEHLSPVEQLQKTIQSLPKTATAEATVRVAAISGEQIDPATRIEILKSEQEAIAKETKIKAEEKELKKQKQIQKEADEAEAIAARVAMEGELLMDNAPEIAARAEEEIKTLNTDEELSDEDLKEIESAIENIAMEKKFNIDEEILQDLKEDVDEYKEDLEDLKSVMLASGGDEEDIKESKSAKRLGKKVDKLVNQLDVKLDELHKKRLKINEEIVLKEKNLIYADIDDIETRDEVMQKISEKKGLVISINDMVLALRRLQKVPDEVRLQKIVTVLDEDKDGIIDASHVLKVIRLLGQENVKLESSQVSELIDLCKKEMLIEEEEKKKEKDEKEKEKQEKTLKENSMNNEETLKNSSE
ncbi:LETM1 [Mytilus edulis]|uniref:Mitochondrial proton/calcium exchanger protein n=1 Tax=Mytilus edulis TaxID=6550 RepID=A0A8S3T1Q3_MYTED|nr:LETM1 [Mytilus edulis]